MREEEEEEEEQREKGVEEADGIKRGLCMMFTYGMARAPFVKAMTKQKGEESEILNSKS